VSARATRLVRLYPPAWRARYGDELEALMADAGGGGRLSWRTRADVTAGAGRERLRAAGLSGDAPPADQARGGALLVLVAWALFVVAGAGVQKFSEHWQAATPAADRAVPAGAFATLVGGAVAGGLAVVAGAVLALPALRAFARTGGSAVVRGRLLAAGVLTSAAAVATVGLVAWAHTLTARQRAGHSLGYTVGFLGWGVLVAGCVAAWTVAAVAIARRMSWPARVLRAEVGLAVAVTAAMAVMTAATAVWWRALAGSAPWFLAGRPVGHPGPTLAPQLGLALAALAAATLLGLAGSWRAVRGSAAHV
jgi:hypothetical protein